MEVRGRGELEGSMEFLDPFDKYFGIAFIVVTGILVNIKLFYIVKKSGKKNFRWIDLYYDHTLAEGISFWRGLQKYNPLFLGTGRYFRINLILTIVASLLLLQIVL